MGELIQIIFVESLLKDIWKLYNIATVLNVYFYFFYNSNFTK